MREGVRNMASVTGRRLSRVVLLRWLAVGSMAAAVALLCGCVPPTTATFWSPDGSAVAYESDGQLCLYDVATKESRQVNTGDLAVMPLAWSPDGKVVACYAGKKDSQEPASLCAVNVTSGEVAVLAAGIWPPPDSGDEANSSETGDAPGAVAEFAILILTFGQPVAWSPDGRRIAYLGASDAGSSVVVVDVAAGAGKRIVESRTCITLISWSPDGRRLAYVTADLEPTPTSPQPALFAYDFATETSTSIANVPGDGPAAGTRLQWSPDSTQIAFIAPDPPNNTAIGYLVDAKPGAEVRKVVRGISEAAAWSPDLKGIAFVEERHDGAVVVLYRGVRPPVRRVLGEITEASPTPPPAYSIPQFPPHGRFLSFLVLTETEEGPPKVSVLPVR